MDKTGKLRDIFLNSLSDEDVIKGLKGAQSATRVYVSDEAPFDVVQERVRLLEQLGAATIELSPEVIVSRGQRLFYSMQTRGLRPPEINPEDLLDLKSQARLLARESDGLSYRVFSDSSGQIVSVDHRAGPRSISIESQLLQLKVSPGHLGVNPVPVAFLLNLETEPEEDATALQVILPESSRLFTYREGRLFYTHTTEGILPPQVDLDYLDYIADQARGNPNSPRNLLFRLFCEETGRVASIERIGGSSLPQIETDLTRAVISPGTLRGVPVPVVFFVTLWLDDSPQESAVSIAEPEWTYDQFMRQEWRTRRVVLQGLPWETVSELKQTHVHRYLAQSLSSLDQDQIRLIGDYLTYLEGDSSGHLIPNEYWREEVRRHFTDQESRSIFSLNGEPIHKNN